MAIELTDDGTMDTVLRCSDCGEEMRYNYDPSGPDDDLSGVHCDTHESHVVGCKGCADASETACAAGYDEFIAWAIEDATAEHECEPSDDDEPQEPEEGDITTEDHLRYYQYGKLVLETRDDINGPMRFNYRMEVHGGGRTSTFVPLGTFDTVEAALRAYMDRTQFWPNCWWISDHGNAHLMTIAEAK